MNPIRRLNSLGMMSDTSLNDVDVAVLKTDGFDIFEYGPKASFNYDDNLREKIQFLLGKKPDYDPVLFAEAARDLTVFHAKIFKEMQLKTEDKIDIIGFHGHTLLHNVKEKYTFQLGDAQMLSDFTQLPVVGHFRTADVLNGGQGAPLTPIFYNALAFKQPKPITIVNIGGISNVTWISADGQMIAFDIGPGNGIINNWVQKHANLLMDFNGKLAITGKVNEQILTALMRHKFLAIKPPKSADANTFTEKMENLESLSLEDGAATATMFVAKAIAHAVANYLPEFPQDIIVTGGGAKNVTLVRFLRMALREKNIGLKTSDELGWDTECIRAQAIAYLAVRRLYHLPATFPSTTGVLEPTICGSVFKPEFGA